MKDAITDLLDTLHGIEDEVTGDAASLRDIRKQAADQFKQLESEAEELVLKCDRLESENEDLLQTLDLCKVCATCGSFRPSGACGKTGIFHGYDHQCAYWSIQ
jgi:predicted  nucleic acid-binding Zn-ribbon protein